MINVGVGQADFKVGHSGTNLEIIQALLDEAAQKQVDVLVLPELANSGYAFASLEEAAALAEEVPTGPVCRALQAWSQPGRMVVSGLCQKSGDVLYNSAVVFSGGDLLAVYHKIHLFSNESKWFQPGQEPAPVLPFRQYLVGIMVCFDWVFPEMTRSLALRGAHIILHPANLVLPFCQKAMITRSIENRVFTATANRCGQERDLYFSGLSQITAPNGSLLVQADEESSGVFCAELDPGTAENKWITALNHVLNDRRPDLYI